MRLKGKLVVICPGDTVRCEPYELGNAKDKFDQLEPDPPPPQLKFSLKVKHRGGGRYDVLNELTGVKINDKTLTKEEAEALAGASVAEAENLNQEDEDQPAGGA